MGILSRRAAARLRLTPERPLLPTEELTATVELADAVRGVSSARVELGYVNRYSYRWAGRRVNASFNRDEHDLLAIDHAGTGYGSDRDTTDWVHVLDAPLPVAGGVLEAGAHPVRLRLPSWAPGSSESLVRWEARLHVERSGRDVEAAESFTVLVPAPAQDAGFADEYDSGQSSDVEIELDRDWWLPGEQLSGRALITPRVEVSTCDLEVRIQRTRVSHPLVRTPGDTLVIDRPVVTTAKGVALTQGVQTIVPFAIEVPPDAAPTTETVHATIAWFVRVGVEHRRPTNHWPDRVRRGFGVHTAGGGPRPA